MKFEEFNLHEDIMRGIKDAGFEEAMPAQERTFKAVLSGKDVTVQSQTGTGKTAAFLISIYQLFRTDVIENKKALIVVPTRELAVQIEEEAEILGKYLDYKTVSIYGGVGYKQQLEKLKAGADFIVGTPGRLLDLEKSNHIDFGKFGVLVIDEADRLFDMGFFPDLRKMLRKLTPRENRRTMLFSATLNTRVLNLAWDQMNEYEEIKIEPEKVTVEEITQELYHVAGHEKFKLLLGILKKEKFENAIIFSNTKNKVAEIAKRLEVNGYKTNFLMGDLAQKKRLDVIKKMKAGELDILVATDVAARGLHVDDLSLVINFDLPEDFENYVHRIGRTARAGNSGKSISLACEKFVYHLPAIENYIGDKISVMIADEELFSVEDASAGMKFRNEYDERRDSRGGGSRNGNRSDSRGGSRGGSRSGGYGGSRGGSRSGGQGGDRNRDRSGDRREGQNRGGSYDRNSRNRDGNRNYDNRGGKPGQKRYDKNRNNDAVNRKPQTSAADKLKRPDASSGVEDRLAYYRAKYGEDFKPSDEMLKRDNSSKTGKSGRKGSSKKKTGAKPAAQQKTEQVKSSPKKQGFFGKLFGKK